MDVRSHPPPSRSQARARLAKWLVPVVIAVSVWVVYRPSLGAPFVFDDEPAIAGNATLRDLWPPWNALQPPADAAGATGRPLVNLSLALNYAAGGLEARGYRATNLWLHVLAAFAAWGVLRRGLALPTLPERLRRRAGPLAAGITLAWAMHPLLTESVIFIVQRNEILAGLFYLLTFYCALRAAGAEPRVSSLRWSVAAAACSWLGVASKEVAATVPLLVFLFDRTFVAGTFRAAWRERRGLYLGLASSWVLLAALMLQADQRAGTVGFGLGVSPWEYLLTQCRAVTLYLKLVVWPAPLVLDYGTPVVKNLGEVWGQAAGLGVLFAAAIWATLRRRNGAGFLGVSFFLILAPSSSFVPLTTQTIAEHRMYLPSLAAIAALLGAAQTLTGRWACFALTAGFVVAGGALTIRRGTDYETTLRIWSDTVQKAPDNPRAHLNLAQALFRTNDFAGAEREYQQAAQLKPDYAEAHYGIGLAADRQGRPLEAIGHYRAALKLYPEYTIVHNDLAGALARTGRAAEALHELDRLLARQPDLPRAQINRGQLLRQLDRPEEAAAAYREALRLSPQSIDALVGLAGVSQSLGRTEDALRQLATARAAAPGDPRVEQALGEALLGAHRPQEAVSLLESAVKHDQNQPAARASLAAALMQSGRRPEALVQYEAAVSLAPAAPELRLGFALALAANGRLKEAVAQGEEALRLRPDFEAARHYVGQMRADMERTIR